MAAAATGARGRQAGLAPAGDEQQGGGVGERGRGGGCGFVVCCRDGGGGGGGPPPPPPPPTSHPVRTDVACEQLVRGEADQTGAPAPQQPPDAPAPPPRRTRPRYRVVVYSLDRMSSSSFLGSPLAKWSRMGCSILHTHARAHARRGRCVATTMPPPPACACCGPAAAHASPPLRTRSGTPRSWPSGRPGAAPWPRNRPPAPRSLRTPCRTHAGPHIAGGGHAGRALATVGGGGRDALRCTPKRRTRAGHARVAEAGMTRMPWVRTNSQPHHERPRRTTRPQLTCRRRSRACA
jgi:hypothetical protein